MAQGPDLTARYEAVRAAALATGGGRAGLGAALLIAQGMAAWMRGTPPPPAARPGPGARAPPAEVVGVLAGMALACAQGG